MEIKDFKVDVFQIDLGKEITEWKVYNNCPNISGMSIQDATALFQVKVTIGDYEPTINDFCKYINSKGVSQAYTEEEFKAAFGDNFAETQDNPSQDQKVKKYVTINGWGSMYCFEVENNVVKDVALILNWIPADRDNSKFQEMLGSKLVGLQLRQAIKKLPERATQVLDRETTKEEFQKFKLEWKK